MWKREENKNNDPRKGYYTFKMSRCILEILLVVFFIKECIIWEIGRGLHVCGERVLATLIRMELYFSWADSSGD